MKFKIKAYNLQELGQRENQEDSLYPALGKSTSDDRLFILCDGMGGHEKGEVASSTVCEVMSKTILSLWNPSEPLTDEIFQQALTAAYDALDAKDNGEERKMGTTMTFLCLHDDGATVAHIGDSRIYQLRPATKKSPARIVFRTQDHSLVNDLVKIGEITEEEAKHHPQKNVITRAMQPCQEHRAKADIAHLTEIQPGDYFYMCSDGMLEEASDENILNIITKPNVADEDKLEMLRQVTEENKDNHTAHLIHIGKVEGKVAIVPEERPRSAVKGTWITPEFDKPKKKRKLLPWVLGFLLIAVVVIASCFFFYGKSESKGVVGPDSIKTDSVKVKPIEQKHDSIKPDTALHHAVPKRPTPPPASSEEKRADDKLMGKDKMQKQAEAKSTDRKEETKPKAVEKFVPKKDNYPKEELPVKSNEKKV